MKVRSAASWGGTIGAGRPERSDSAITLAGPSGTAQAIFAHLGIVVLAAVLLFPALERHGQSEVALESAAAEGLGPVVGVHGGDDTGQMVVDVQVPFDDAAELAARAATGRVALVLDSRER